MKRLETVAGVQHDTTNWAQANLERELRRAEAGLRDTLALPNDDPASKARLVKWAETRLKVAMLDARKGGAK